MRLLIKLYAESHGSGPRALSASLPICIVNKHDFEITVRDLKQQIQTQLQ